MRLSSLQTQIMLFEFVERLKTLCCSGRLLEAIEMLCGMGSRADAQTYAFLLQECINLKELFGGLRIHAQMLIVGFSLDLYLMNKLIILYSKYGDMRAAHYLFDRIQERSLVTWNSLISGYVQRGVEQQGLVLYYNMRRTGLKPDHFTFASLFRACSCLATLDQGRRAHAVLVKTVVAGNVVVNSALIDMYFKCSSLSDGRQVFDKMPERNTITWTTLLSGYSQHGRVQEVLRIFHMMIREGFTPNYITFVAVLSACSRGGLIDEGHRYFLSMIRDYNIQPRGEHIAAMVDLLGRAGRFNEAYELVDRYSCVDHSTIWGAFLGACRLHGKIELAETVARRLFELDPANSGKYIVLSNTYASCGLWDNVSYMRQRMRSSGMRKVPGCSWIEVQEEVHLFLAGDGYHEKTWNIYETVEKLDKLMKGTHFDPTIVLKG